MAGRGCREQQSGGLVGSALPSVRSPKPAYNSIQAASSSVDEHFELKVQAYQESRVMCLHRCPQKIGLQ